jgi:transposase
MKFINGTNRNQLPLFASSIDDAIAQDNEIRLIDLFVDSLKLPHFGFTFDFIENGRPAYHPSDLSISIACARPELWRKNAVVTWNSCAGFQPD